VLIFFPNLIALQKCAVGILTVLKNYGQPLFCRILCSTFPYLPVQWETSYIQGVSKMLGHISRVSF
jgi:hypothetical protein